MQAVEERDDNPGSAKDNERLLIERDIDVGGFHPTSLAGPDRVLVENGSVVLWPRGTHSQAWPAPLASRHLEPRSVYPASSSVGFHSGRQACAVRSNAGVPPLAAGSRVLLYTFIGRITIGMFRRCSRRSMVSAASLCS